VFKIQKTETSTDGERPADLDNPYDYFLETLYEHSAPVTAIEKNFKEPSLFASGGKDSKVFIWNLEGQNNEVEFITEIGKAQLFKPGGSVLNQGYVTALRWYDENTLTLSLTNGTLQFNDIRIKQGKGDETLCSACSLVAKVEGPIWDTALWRNQAGVNIIFAEDSGRVTLVDPRMAGKDPIVLTVNLFFIVHISFCLDWNQAVSFESER
jgi:WD40 repeat protein